MYFLSACRVPRSIVPIALILGFMGKFASAQNVVSVTEIAPGTVVFATGAGNVVASVGPDGALLVGTPSAESTPQISGILASRTKSAARYVVIAPQDPLHSDGDAGWGRLGAFAAMQENGLRRLGGDAMGAPAPLQRRFIQLGVDRPRVAFSDVLAFDLNGDAIHIVHQTPGYSDADAIAHFHVARVVYLGEVFPGDGYPEIDPKQGGKLDGVVKTLSSWTGNSVRIVPARGRVANGADVEAFHNMIVTVRERVQHLIGAGLTEDQVLREHPTAEFDARWGHGRVSPDAFVREVYSGLRANSPHP